ncbi:Hypothetical predicted protein, partial [Olea europaea subsp. europaea]
MPPSIAGDQAHSRRPSPNSHRRSLPETTPYHRLLLTQAEVQQLSLTAIGNFTEYFFSAQFLLVDVAANGSVAMVWCCEYGVDLAGGM